MVAGHHAHGVGPSVGQQALHSLVGGVDAEDELAVLGLGAHEELRGVGTGHGGDQRHGGASGQGRRASPSA